MANVRWRGGAAPTTQVTTFLFGGTWETDDVVRVVIGSKKYDFATGSATISTLLDTLVAAWLALSATDYPEFAEVTPSRSGNTLVLTCGTTGVPFTATLTPLESDLSAAGAQTIEGAGVATTGTASVAATGPNFWSEARNWSGGAVPVNADVVYLSDSADDIKYGLAQSAVTVAAIYQLSTWTGTLGLPKINAGGYPEYRDDYLAIGATLIVLEDGAGQASGRTKINVGSVQTTVTVKQTGTPLDQYIEAFLLKGTHASNVVNVLRGSVGIAVYGEETATVLTLNVNFLSNQDSDAQVRCGAGVTLTTLVQTGGAVELNSALTTLKKTGGKLLAEGTGAVTTLTNDAGLVDYRSSGTITTLNIGAAGFVDFSGDSRTKTVTNCTIYASGAINNPGRCVTWSNPIQLLHRGSVGGLSQLAMGDNIAVLITYL